MFQRGEKSTLGGAAKYGGRGIPYFTEAERSVRAEVRWWLEVDREAKRVAVSCDCGVLDDVRRRDAGQVRVECVRRLI